MTKAAAIHAFWNRFLTAFEENNVPGGKDKPDFPYMTYQLVTGFFAGGPVETTTTLWYRADSNIALNAKVEEISEAIGEGGVNIACESGIIWIKRSSPFALPIRDDTDKQVKGRQLNIQTEFWTDK